MRFLVFLQNIIIYAISFFCLGAFIAIAYRGFQESVIWGLAGIVIGLIVASVLFKIGKVINKLLFGMIYMIVMPKELKDAMRKNR